MGIWVDNFAGGGGASLAIHQAIGKHVSIAVNHDGPAIAMHQINHPETEHFQEDVRDINPREVLKGRAIDGAWFSPDCKHFSRAKGGVPVDKDIRGLAWVVMKWAALPAWQRPKIIFLENVVEFLTWGPISERTGKPLKSKMGQTFKHWRKQLEDLGYTTDYRELRACDYGAPTIRNRLFFVARCDGHPITWPEPTHADPRHPGSLLPWRPAHSIIDWSVPCPSIFERKRPLAENTCRRIAAGLKRFVLDNPEPFIIKPNHKYKWFRGQSIHDPLQTTTGKNDKMLVTPYIDQAYGQSRGVSAEDPLGSITGMPKASVIQPFIDRPFGTSSGASDQHDIEKPLGSITAQGGGGKCAVVSPFIQHIQHSKAKNGTMPADEPLRTITAKPKGGGMAMVSAWMAQHNTGVVGRDIRDPLSTIVDRGTQQNLVTVNHDIRTDHSEAVYAFLSKYNGTQQAPDLFDPLPTVTTKDRFALITASGDPIIIYDIGMRMLTPRELYNAQGFPEDYKIDGFPKTQQVSKCGNSVSPPPARALVLGNAWMYAADDIRHKYQAAF